MFKNKRVVITGGSEGIGFACAEYFLKREAAVSLPLPDNYRAAAFYKDRANFRQPMAENGSFRVLCILK